MARVSESINLHGLLDHPGWIALKEHHERGKQQYMNSLAKRLLIGQKVSEEEIAYYRGCHDIAGELFRYPEQALASLERTAQKLWAAHIEEEVTTALAEESPYIRNPPRRVHE